MNAATLAYRPCSICTDERKREFVLANHLAGVSANRMEAMARATIGFVPMKAETILKHVRVCLPRSFSPSATTAKTPAGLPVQRQGEGLDIARAARTDVAIARRVQGGAPADDVARMVQEQVIEKLKSGEARVTVQHGLQAQQILDRRDERAKDRALAVTLTRLLHQPGAPTAIIDVTPVDPQEADLLEEETLIGVP